MSKTHKVTTVTQYHGGDAITITQTCTPKKYRVPRKIKKRGKILVARLKKAAKKYYLQHGRPEKWSLNTKK